jgi:hypothetical protein
MIRAWKLICLCAFLAALFAVAPVPAQENAPKNTDKPDKIEQQLKAITDQIAALKKETKEALDGVRSDLKNFRTDHDVALQAANREIVDLKTELGRLRSDLEVLRNSAGGTTRQAGFAPSAANPPPATGWVELLNTWTAPITVKVNNQTYRLRPGERVLTERIPAGTFNYEVFGVTPPNNVRTLTPNEVYLIHIHPQL